MGLIRWTVGHLVLRTPVYDLDIRRIVFTMVSCTELTLTTSHLSTFARSRLAIVHISQGCRLHRHRSHVFVLGSLESGVSYPPLAPVNEGI